MPSTSSDNGAFFSTPRPSANEPIVCTADLDQGPTIRKQMDGYRAAFTHLLRTENFPGGFRWIFAARPGLAAELRTLAENEHQCCGFFKFDLRDAGDSLIWETTGNKESAAVLAEFAQLPSRLTEHARGEDLSAIKQRISAAGLRFSGDEGS